MDCNGDNSANRNGCNAQNNGTEAQSLDARRQSIAEISTVNSLELIDIDAIAFGAKSDVLQLKKS